MNAALNDVMKGRTTFVYRDSVFPLCGMQAASGFDQGRIVESGTFYELVRKGPLFAELAKARIYRERTNANLKRHLAIAQ